MPWQPQWWRAQRNAIRNVNCRSPWIIKSLNAHGTTLLSRMPVWAFVSTTRMLFLYGNDNSADVRLSNSWTVGPVGVGCSA